MGFEDLLSQMNNFRVDVLPKYLYAKLEVVILLLGVFS